MPILEIAAGVALAPLLSDVTKRAFPTSYMAQRAHSEIYTADSLMKVLLENPRSGTPTVADAMKKSDTPLRCRLDDGAPCPRGYDACGYLCERVSSATPDDMGAL